MGPYVGCWDIMFPPSYFCLLDANLQPTGLRQQYNGFCFWHFFPFDISFLLTFLSFWHFFPFDISFLLIYKLFSHDMSSICCQVGVLVSHPAFSRSQENTHKSYVMNCVSPKFSSACFPCPYGCVLQHFCVMTQQMETDIHLHWESRCFHFIKTKLSALIFSTYCLANMCPLNFDFLMQSKKVIFKM